MNEVLDRIGSYDILTNLLPGAALSYLVTTFTDFEWMHEDIIFGLFIYYFVGLFVSRIGSNIIQPLLEKIGFVKLSDYEDYVAAKNLDKGMGGAVEACNTYRSFLSVGVCFSLMIVADDFFKRHKDLEVHIPFIIVFAILALFLFAWRKQVGIIAKWVEIATPSDEESAGEVHRS